jgi:predicted RNA binding protein YcfA (HicA-like mRNA interferase family)
MVVGFYNAVRSLLVEHGCYIHRQGKGSHEIWKSPVNGNIFPVPFKLLKKGTANTILKQAGINKRL